MPILFPRILEWRADRTGETHEIIVSTERDALFAGDYCLEFPKGTRHDRLCTIERKGRVSEIYTNLFTDDWKRCCKAFHRLRNTMPPTPPYGARYLLIEPSHAEFVQYERDHILPEGIILDRLIQVACAFDLRLLFTSASLSSIARRRLGERILRLMLGHIFHHPFHGKPYSDHWYEAHRQDAQTWRNGSK
jgi:hypothetical protein